MKRIFGVIITVAVIFGAIAHGQKLKAAVAGHSVNMTWTASVDSTTANPGTVGVWRMSGACPASITTGSFTALTNAAPAGGPYTDTTVTAGTWCYFVTADFGATISGPSNTVQAVILPLAPSGLAIGSSD